MRHAWQGPLGPCSGRAAALDVEMKAAIDDLDFIEMLRTVDDLEDLLYVVVAEFHAAKNSIAT